MSFASAEPIYATASAAAGLFASNDSWQSSPGSQSPLALRRHDRIITRVPAVLYVGKSFQITIIRDISPGGARLEGANGVLPGDAVEIKLVTGQSRSAVVRWWLNGSCGVSFDAPLEAGDPFLQRALRNARKTSPSTAAAFA